jgi:hypothetical protein
MLPSAPLQKGLSALLPAVLSIAIAIWEIAATARATRGVPGADDWQRASDVVRTGWHQGDLIVFAPEWIDPVGREHLGDLITLDQAGRMDADRYGTIWELSIRGAHAPETRGLAPAWRVEVGDVLVQRFERAPAVVVTDLVRAPFEGGGARVVLAEVGFAPHRCVQVVPAPDGTVSVDYGSIELGSSLVGYVGLADVFTRRDVRDPGRLDVRIDDAQVASVIAGVEDGWVRFAVDTSPGRHHVVLDATAVGPGARDRRICFAAEARQ